jgi:multicomponent Na+:H+ antiporter subunit G
MSLMIEILKGVLLFVGCLFVLISAIGMFRFKSFPVRMQAGGKAAAMGLGLLLAAEVLDGGSWEVALKGLAAMVLLFLTMPIASHALMRTWWRGEK